MPFDPQTDDWGFVILYSDGYWSGPGYESVHLSEASYYPAPDDADEAIADMPTDIRACVVQVVAAIDKPTITLVQHLIPDGHY